MTFTKLTDAAWHGIVGGASIRDATQGRFPSVTTNKELGSRANEAQDTVAPMFTY